VPLHGRFLCALCRVARPELCFPPVNVSSSSLGCGGCLVSVLLFPLLMTLAAVVLPVVLLVHSIHCIFLQIAQAILRCTV
jgi:hypothetical protein